MFCFQIHVLAALCAPYDIILVVMKIIKWEPLWNHEILCFERSCCTKNSDSVQCLFENLQIKVKMIYLNNSWTSDVEMIEHVDVILCTVKIHLCAYVWNAPKAITTGFCWRARAVEKAIANTLQSSLSACSPESMLGIMMLETGSKWCS